MLNRGRVTIAVRRGSVAAVRRIASRVAAARSTSTATGVCGINRRCNSCDGEQSSQDGFARERHDRFPCLEGVVFEYTYQSGMPPFVLQDFEKRILGSCSLAFLLVKRPFYSRGHRFASIASWLRERFLGGEDEQTGWKGPSQRHRETQERRWPGSSFASSRCSK